MNQETFQIFLWVMSAVALVVFIALYFVKAGYGMFRTAGICRAGIFLLPAVSVALSSAGLYFSVPAER